MRYGRPASTWVRWNCCTVRRAWPILDQGGTQHGRKAHLIRLLQKWTYYEQTLSLYTVGMREGSTLIVIPSGEERSAELAALLVPHGARAAHYFGLDRVEELTGA